MSETVDVSRRMFMTAGAATALSLGTNVPSIGESTPTTLEPVGLTQSEASRFDQPGSPSRKAERAWARAEYDHQKRMRDPDDLAQQGSPTSPNFDRVLDAVEDVGCDPSGNRPISEDMDGSVMQDGTLVVFPPGRYLLTTKFHASVDGRFGMVGKGYQNATQPPTPGSDTATIVTPSQSRTRLTLTAATGLLANFVVDQRSRSSLTGIAVESKGFAQARDVRFVGVQDNTGAGVPDSLGVSLCALQSDEGATARAERVVGRYVGLPGDKNSGGAPMFWVGQSNSGLAQLGHCVSQGAADNGLYGGRTPGDVHVKGGKWINNEVAQLRYSGRGSWADGPTLVIDKSRYEGPTAGGGFNEQFGTNGIKIERGDNGYPKPGGAELRNADIRVLSVGTQGIGAPVFVRGSGGALKIENSRIVNQLGGEPSVVATAPGEGYSGHTSPPPHNITIAYSLFEGTNAESVIRVNGRENSLITDTCIKIPGTGPGSITGMRVGSGVGFGNQCKAGGLKAPKNVGSSGNLSAVNISYNGSVTGNSSVGAGASNRKRKQRRKALFTGVTSGIFFLLFLIFGMVVLFVVGGMALLGGLAALLGGD